MPSHAAAGVSGSRGKARSRLKHYHRKNNSNMPSRYAQQQDATFSSPQPEYNYPRLPARSFPKGGNIARSNLPLPPRYNQRKPWVGIFGAEREPGNITILRRQDAEKPKGSVPSWLADTFGSLPKKHPLRETVNDSAVTQPMNLDSDDDDDNPFAYQPPSPSRIPSNDQDLVFSYPTQIKPTRAHATPLHRMGLSSVPFAPPTFIEPTYEDHYQDMTIPLNDFDYDWGSEDRAYLTDITSSGGDLEPVLPSSRAMSRFASPQRMTSPVLLPGGYSPSPIATTPTLDTISSDDITIPTPTHNNTLTPERDEIHDALRASHPFVTSMYASSPAGSFRGLSFDTPIGSRESSPHSLILTSHKISTPDAVYDHIWMPRKGILPQAHVPSRPTSSDVYKSRLLAYATAIADQMSIPGDEDSVRQQTSRRVDLPETERAASSPVTGKATSFGQLDKRSLDTLPEGLEPPEHGNDYAATPGLYTETLDSSDWTRLELAKPAATSGLAQNAASYRIHTTPSVFGTPDNDRIGDELAPTDFGGNFDMANTHLEDCGKEHQMQDIVDEFEDEPLVSEYEDTQEEYDVLAADEPSDDESGLAEQYQATTPRRGSEGEHSVPEVDNSTTNKLLVAKRDPKIQPFPMKISHFGPVRTTATPGESQPMLSRLSPKFLSQPSRHVRPSPFAALLKKRFKDYPDAAGPKSQDDAVDVENKEDEIESWLG